MQLSNPQKWALAAVAVFGAAALFGKKSGGGGGAMLAAPVTPLRIRVDALGDGHYGSSRAGHVHKGLDLETWPGQPVRSPVAGIVTRSFYVYDDSTRWTGVEVKTPSGVRVKLMYVAPSIALQSSVQIGDVLGTAQPIHERYGSAMQDHIHVEVWTPSGATVDPEPLFGDALAGCPCRVA